MKNTRKGFTFVELLGVITIIGILALISLPTIERLTKENREKVYQQQLNNIILSLKSWASDNRLYLPEEENEILTITLGNLKSDGYIEYEVKNPLTNKCFDNSMSLIITKIKKNYDYSIDLSTIKETDNCDIDVDSPIIALNGNVIENVEVNSVYIDKGVVAKDKDGNDITDNVITTITGSGNAVDTSKIGNQYIITYSVTSNDKTTQVTRTIKIVDTKSPELVIPSDATITTAVTNLDVLEGVSVSDNSGEIIEVKSKNNIVFGTSGKYTITYTATDSSGNTTTKKRIVTISKVVNGIMASDSSCIKNTDAICPNGTLVNVQVNDSQYYNFYVINDTGTKLTLIMDRNIGSPVAWVSKSDYTAVGGSETDFGGNGNTNLGPITVLNYLNSQTSSWTNILGISSYKYDNNLNGTKYSYGYQKLVVTNGTGVLTSQEGTINTTLTGTMRARLLTYDEYSSLKTANSNITPTWLYENLSSTNTLGQPYGYWFLTAAWDDPWLAWGAYVSGYHGDGNFVYPEADIGARPVIEISK